VTRAVPYRVVDVFTTTPFAGNALCVVLDDVAGHEQAIAREANLSETTFPVRTGDGAYRMRIFTPGSELPFAGHPTLGTAWTMGQGRWEQTTSGAVVTVAVDGAHAELAQPDPEVREVDAEGVADALGLPGVEGAWLGVSGGTPHVLVPTASPLDGLTPDLGAVAAVAGRVGGISLCPFRRVDDRTLHVRVFVPGAGVPEDPGTGSAAGPIAVLAHERWSTDVDVTIRQGAEIGRPCTIEARGARGDVRVGGDVVASAEGRFLLP
jgi:trans-2,3-dihydro-3-hydroxyanthranilate isomerase